ncbi:extensin-like [Miscanthus floridulus]|uniref:extensin-like n=1 Tax=Miscanthus floridulus TaxID=154761 RepID=UPI00345AEEDB
MYPLSFRGTEPYVVLYCGGIPASLCSLLTHDGVSVPAICDGFHPFGAADGHFIYDACKQAGRRTTLASPSRVKLVPEDAIQPPCAHACPPPPPRRAPRPHRPARPAATGRPRATEPLGRRAARRALRPRRPRALRLHARPRRPTAALAPRACTATRRPDAALPAPPCPRCPARLGPRPALPPGRPFPWLRRPLPSRPTAGRAVPPAGPSPSRAARCPRDRARRAPGWPFPRPCRPDPGWLYAPAAPFFQPCPAPGRAPWTTRPDAIRARPRPRLHPITTPPAPTPSPIREEPVRVESEFSPSCWSACTALSHHCTDPPWPR